MVLRGPVDMRAAQFFCLRRGKKMEREDVAIVSRSRMVTDERTDQPMSCRPESARSSVF